MAVMRVAQVSRPKGPFEIVERPDSGAGRRVGADQGAGVRHLPQRFDHQGGAFPGNSVPAGSRP